jgi:hypothetical protein
MRSVLDVLALVFNLSEKVFHVAKEGLDPFLTVFRI